MIDSYNSASKGGRPQSGFRALGKRIIADFQMEQESQAAPPAVPIQTSPGPTLAPTSAGFDIQVKSPPEAERLDEELLRLHQQLRRRANRLAASMPRIGNTHAALEEEFGDYLEFLAADLVDLDVTSFWAVGTGLGAHIRALNRTGPNVMTPELEPDIVAQLETLMAVHAAFILGFSAAREMQARIAQARAAAQADPNLPVQTQTILRSMAETPHLLAAKARRLVNSLVRSADAAPNAAFDLLTSRYETARNGVIAFIQATHPLIEAAEKLTLASFALTALTGQPTDLMQITAVYLNAHMPDIMALFYYDSNTIDWLNWAIRRLRGNNG